jgi:hypothetical protein
MDIERRSLAIDEVESAVPLLAVESRSEDGAEREIAAEAELTGRGQLNALHQGHAFWGPGAGVLGRAFCKGAPLRATAAAASCAHGCAVLAGRGSAT